MSKKTLLLFIASAAIIVAASIAAWVKIDGDGAKDDVTEVPIEIVTKRPPFAPPREAPEGSAEYRNVFHRFQLLHPDTLEVSEEKVAAGTTLITFVSTFDDRSFQVFIVPHGETEITDHRLQSDLPSGVMNNPQETTIGGIKATVFESEAAGIGATREVWFVNKGFLYEVTTAIENDEWLSEIMTNWMFL